MKNDDMISVRVSSEFRDALKHERRHMSREVGVEVKESAVVRAVLELGLRELLRQRSSRGATA